MKETEILGGNSQHLRKEVSTKNREQHFLVAVWWNNQIRHIDKSHMESVAGIPDLDLLESCSTAVIARRWTLLQSIHP